MSIQLDLPAKHPGDAHESSRSGWVTINRSKSDDGGQAETASAVDEQLRIHEYERQRMGQELHDSAGQLLVALQLSVARL